MKVGVFDGKTLVETQTFETLDQTARTYLEKFELEHIMISTVRKEDPDLTFFQQSGLILKLDADTTVPLQSMYRTPATLGNDRLAGAVGARSVFPDRNVCIIDAGTCVTYDVVSKDGVYLGGNISPGLEMRYAAMHQLTSKLPKVERKGIERLLALSTEEAIQNGGLLGLLMEMAGYIEVLRQKFNGIVCILTGGDSEYFAERLKTEIFVRPNLVLEGLNEILLSHVAKAN